VVGAPAKVRGPLSGGAEWWVRNNPEIYRQLAKRHLVTVRPV
jgi:carbonic anhydrase/acetyltransferase-like protein (isoleucine patch superfamily)